MPVSSYDEKYLALLKDVVLSLVDKETVMVFLFGSRLSENHSLMRGFVTQIDS